MGRKVGPYEIVRRLAVGGVAEIFLANKGGMLGFEQQYAVKLLLPHRARREADRQALIEEARLTAQLDHPNVVKVHDLGEDGDDLYVVMEYVHGLDLSRIIKLATEEDETIPIPIAVYIAEEMCAGLHYAHTRTTPDGEPLQLVHRDVSPQNVLVGFGGEVKLVDFGVAKATTSKRPDTKTGIIKGKLIYMAPEYAVGTLQDARSDVFATGLCLYEALTGRAAYVGDDPDELLDAVKFAKIPNARRFREDLPVELATIVRTALETHPDDRYQTASEFQRALASFRARHAPDFTKDEAARWLTRLGQEPTPSAPVVDDDDALAPDAQTFGLDNDGPRIPPEMREESEEDVAETGALRSEDLDTMLAARQKPSPVPEAAGPDAQTGKLSKADVLLGLKDLGRLRDEGDEGDDQPSADELSVLETIAIEEEKKAPSIVGDADSDMETIDPDAGLRVGSAPSAADESQADDIPTSEMEVSRIAPERAPRGPEFESEGPTETDLAVGPDFEDEGPTQTTFQPGEAEDDVSTQPGDNPGTPEIMTPSGFQRSMSAEELQRIRAGAGAPTVREGPEGESTSPTRHILPPRPNKPPPRPNEPPADVSSDSAEPAPTPAPASDVPANAAMAKMAGAAPMSDAGMDVQPDSSQSRGSNTAEVPLGSADEPAGTASKLDDVSGEEPVKPRKRRLPGLEGPSMAGDPEQKIGSMATGLVNKVSKRYNEFGKTEKGRRTKDAVIVVILAIVFVAMVAYVFFLSS